MSEEQGRLIGRVAKVDGDKRLVMLIEPAHLLQGREVQALQNTAVAAPPPPQARVLAKAA
jgi:purine-binding chemotaxis protein CheW